MNTLVQYSSDPGAFGTPALPGADPSVSMPGSRTAIDGIPKFELRAVRKADGTYENVEYMAILTPGDKNASPTHKVTPALRQKYAAYYDLWRRGLQESPVGTPLEMWPVLTPAQIHALKAANIFTVEDLEAIPDANLDAIPFGRTLKVGATTWLKAKKEADAIDTLTREKEETRGALRMMEEQNKALIERLARLEEAQAARAIAPPAAAPIEVAPAAMPDDDPMEVEAPDVSAEAPEEPKRRPGRPAKAAR